MGRRKAAKNDKREAKIDFKREIKSEKFYSESRPQY